MHSSYPYNCMETKDHQRGSVETFLTAMYFTLSQRRGLVLRMGAEQIPKSLLYGELVVDKRN